MIVKKTIWGLIAAAFILTACGTNNPVTPSKEKAQSTKGDTTSHDDILRGQWFQFCEAEQGPPPLCPSTHTLFCTLKGDGPVIIGYRWECISNDILGHP